MLRKLLKYDFRALFRIFPLVWVSVLAMTGLGRLLTTIPFEQLEENLFIAIIVTLTNVMDGFLLVGMMVFALIYVVTRYYNGLLRDEGYLMFTLPTTPMMLLISKLISAFCVLLISGLVALCGCWILTAGTGVIPWIAEVLSEVGKDLLGHNEIWWLTAAGAVAGIFEQVTQIYLAGAVGNLANNKKLLFSVLTYIGINMAKSTLANTVTLALIGQGSVKAVGILTWGSVILSLVMSGLFFFFTELILRKHLNLE